MPTDKTLTAGPGDGPSASELNQAYGAGPEPVVPEPKGAGAFNPPKDGAVNAPKGIAPGDWQPPVVAPGDPPLAPDDTRHPPVTTQPSEPIPTFLWIVVHTNRYGVNFATRVVADTAESAGKAVLSAHDDNTIVDAVPDDGRAEHAVGGTMLAVNDLRSEP